MGKGQCASSGIPPKHGACEEVQAKAVMRACRMLSRKELQLCASAVLSVPESLCHSQSLGDSEGCPCLGGDLWWGRVCAATAAFGHLAL